MGRRERCQAHCGAFEAFTDELEVVAREQHKTKQNKTKQGQLVHIIPNGLANSSHLRIGT